MSRLKRRLLFSIKEHKSLKDKLWLFYDNIIECITPKIYYDVRNYCRNFVLFNKLAWGWRCWDSSFSISVFAKLLVENGKACKKGSGINGYKRYIKACVLAHNLERAYNYSCTDDRAYLNFVAKYPFSIQNHRFTRGYEEGSKQEKLYNTIDKRVDATEAKLKKEAWEQIYKYIEFLWD